MARPEKVAVVEEIRTKLDEAEAAVLTEYRGLSVHDLADLRASLRPSDTQYKVFKNTLALRAIEGRGLDDIAGLFEGPVAIAFVRGDAAAAAKAGKPVAAVNLGVTRADPLVSLKIEAPCADALAFLLDRPSAAS